MTLNGIGSFFSSKERVAKIIYEVCFVLNILTIFVLYQVKTVATVTAALMFVSASFLLLVRGKKKTTIPYISIWYGIFIIYATLSSTWSEYFDSQNLFLIFRMGVILLISMSIAFYVDTSEDLERILSLFIFSVCVIVVTELIYTPVSQWNSGFLGSNLSGSNSNEVAFWVACAEMMAFYKAYVKNKKFAYILTAFLITFIILSSSRKALLMAIAGPAILVIMSTRKKFYMLRIIIAVIIISFLIYFVMNNEDAYHTVGRRIESMLTFFINDDKNEDSSLRTRQYMISLAKSMFAESPILGKGIANFSMYFLNDLGTIKTYSHNNYWQILSELGVVGLLIYYSFYAICFIKLLKRVLREHNQIALLALTFLLLLIIFEVGIVSCYSKYCQLVVAIIFTATYVSDNDGRKYKYKDNAVINSMH